MYRRRFIVGSAAGLALVAGCIEQAEEVHQAMEEDDDGGEGQKSGKKGKHETEDKRDDEKANDDEKDDDEREDEKEEFEADLSGENEVPPVDTEAEGEATFTLADHDEGPHLHYELHVEDIENVTQAHIHVGAEDENGDVVLFLFGAEENGEFVGALEEGDAVDVGDEDRLAEGSATADDLVGPLEGMDLSALAEEMRAGNTYVNVHTTQNPAGEIRGQIEADDDGEDEMDDDGGDEAETETEDESDSDSDDSDSSGGSGSVDDWLSGTSNYGGSVKDETGESSPDVKVGAEGNGGPLAFDPPAIRVSAGTEVTWEWTGDGGAAHNVVAEDGSFSSGAPEAGSDVEYSYTFDEAGTYLYLCEPHESLGMKGAVVVE